MKITKLTNLSEKYIQHDITTSTENFYARVGDGWVLIHNSPSCAFGHDKDGRFFVGTKSIFNKDPKINRTNDEIDKNHGHAPGLVEKLKSALKYLPHLGTTKIHQGDILFTDGDVSRKIIDGVDCYTFRPNTIRYAVPVDSPMGHKVAKAKIGIAVHTLYDDHGNITSADEDALNQHSDVFVLPVGLKHGPEFDSELDDHLSEIGKAFQKTPKSVFDYVSQSTTQPFIMQYINSEVRKGNDDKMSGEGYINYLNQWHQKEIDKVKNKAGKEAKRDSVIKDARDNIKNIDTAFDIFSHIVRAKHMIVDKLNTSQDIGHYLDNPDGSLSKTNPEGYVVIGSKGSLKLVRRGVFSKDNFAASKNR